jgi:hypothetical protein
MARMEMPERVLQTPAKFVQIATGTYSGNGEADHVLYALDSEGQVWIHSPYGWDLHRGEHEPGPLDVS